MYKDIFQNIHDMNKKVIEIILKVLIYALGLVLGLLTGCAVSSCSSPSPTLSQKGIIIINDTIYLGNHEIR